MSRALLSATDLAGLTLVEARAGTRLRLRVSPGAKSDAILGVHDGALKLSVTAPPDRGRANEAVVELLARALRVPASAIELTAGHGSRSKVASVALAPDAIRERLAVPER